MPIGKLLRQFSSRSSKGSESDLSQPTLVGGVLLGGDANSVPPSQHMVKRMLLATSGKNAKRELLTPPSPPRMLAPPSGKSAGREILAPPVVVSGPPAPPAPPALWQPRKMLARQSGKSADRKLLAPSKQALSGQPQPALPTTVATAACSLSREAEALAVLLAGLPVEARADVVRRAEQLAANADAAVPDGGAMAPVS